MKKKEEAVEAKFNPNEGLTIKHVGLIVHYHKTILTSAGNKLETVPAMITRISDMAAGNLQKKDCAADLKVFSSHKGGSDENKFQVRFSAEPQDNRWTLID